MKILPPITWGLFDVAFSTGRPERIPLAAGLTEKIHKYVIGHDIHAVMIAGPASAGSQPLA